jgi:hypothetical protein
MSEISELDDETINRWMRDRIQQIEINIAIEEAADRGYRAGRVRRLRERLAGLRAELSVLEGNDVDGD